MADGPKRATGEPAADQDRVGKTYRAEPVTIEQAHTEAYADATDDANPRYRGADAVAPPMFHVRPVMPLMMQMARDPELVGIDMLRLVHGEHAMRFARVLRPGEVLSLSGALQDVAIKSSGAVYTFALCGDVDGERVLDGSTSYFIRAPKPPERSAGEKKPAPSEPPPADWTVEQAVTDDQAVRYADASGDRNPIHLDEAVAQKAGLPGCILHGLCTLAFAQRDLIDRACDGDPARLAALSTRFTGMVLPGDTLTFEVRSEEGALGFRTLGRKGRPVLVGRAEVRG
jgi:acyl dehydratase